MRALIGPLTLLAATLFGAATVASAPVIMAASGAKETVSLQTVMLEGATEATIDVSLDSGELWLGGGSMATGTVVATNELLRGDFTFQHDQAPTLTYELSGQHGEGHLVIAPPESDSLWSWDRSEQRWRLYVNPTIPTRLRVEVGSGDTELVVGGMRLTDLSVASGSGNVTLDLTGDWRTSLDATIEIGAGDLVIRTPREIGVMIIPSQGVGAMHGQGFTQHGDAYVNAAYGTTTDAIEIKVKQGAGYIEIVEM